MADTDKKFLDEDGVNQFAEETKKYIDKHADNDDIHVTPSDRTNWDGKADDDGVVHTTGDETIDGNKTFTGTTSGTLFSGNFECNNKTSYYDTDYFYALEINDGKASINNISNDTDNRLTLSVLSDNKKAGNVFSISIPRDAATASDTSGFYIQWIGKVMNGVVPTRDNAFSLGLPDFRWENLYVRHINGKDIVYTSDLPDLSPYAIDADVVHNAGNETVGGIKTFTSSMVVDGSGKLYQAYASDYIKGGVPSAAMYQGLRFYDDQKISTVGNHITGAFEIQYSTDGYNKAYVACRNYAGTTQHNYNVGLRVPNDLTRSIDFYPSANNKINLGASSYKWADVNTVLLNGKTPAYADDLAGYATKVHTHTKSDITDFPAIPTKTSQLTNDSGFLTSVAWDSITGKPSSFTPSSHTHDDRYYTESEINTKLSGKSDTTHNHNYLYLGINAKASSASSADNANYATTAGNGVESSGTNYIRYKDGTQICWGEDVDSNTITFPMPFINDKYSCHVNHTGTSSNIAYGFAQRTTTNAFVTASAAYNYNYFCYVAIGKWK